MSKDVERYRFTKSGMFYIIRISKILGSIFQTFPIFILHDSGENNMIRKIAFLCVNPWESFQPSFSRGNAQEHYQWIYQEAVQRRSVPCCQQVIDIYGDDLWEEERPKSCSCYMCGVIEKTC